MASLIGAKRETVSECLAILELDEIVSTLHGRMVLLQPAKLDQIL